MRVLSLIVASAAIASAAQTGSVNPLARLNTEKFEEIKAACSAELDQCNYNDDLPLPALPKVLQCLTSIDRSDACTSSVPREAIALLSELDAQKLLEMRYSCFFELNKCGFSEFMPASEIPDVLDCMKESQLSIRCTDSFPKPPAPTAGTNNNSQNRAEKLEAIKEACTEELAECGYLGWMEPSRLWEVMKCVKSSDLSDVCEAVLPAKQPKPGRGSGSRAEKLETIKEFCDDELTQCGYADGMTKEEMMSVMSCMKSSVLSEVCSAALPNRPHGDNTDRVDVLQAAKESCAAELAVCGFQEGMTKEELRPVRQCMKASEKSQECAEALAAGRQSGSTTSSTASTTTTKAARDNRFVASAAQRSEQGQRSRRNRRS